MRSRSLVVVAIAVVLVLAVGLLGVTLLLRDTPTRDDEATEPVRSERSSQPASSPAPGPASATATPSSSGAVIRTSRDLYFGRPYETIAIRGRYVGASQSSELRVQVLRADGWQTFPLPTVTKESGRFRAYVELGGGQHRLRLVDPATGTRSQVLTVLLF